MRLERYEFDAEYVDRLIREDPDVERHFTEYFGALLTLKLQSRLRSAAAVQDAKQETFVRVLQALKQKGGLENPASLGGFVNSVCNNVLFELYRADRRSSPLDDNYDAPERQPSADSQLIAGEEREAVRAALAALAPRERKLLKWLFFDERQKDDICRDLQIDRNHLRVLLHRARNQFRHQYRTRSAEIRP